MTNVYQFPNPYPIDRETKVLDALWEKHNEGECEPKTCPYCEGDK